MEQTDREIDLIHLLKVSLRRWKLIVSVVLISTLCGLGIGLIRSQSVREKQVQLQGQYDEARIAFEEKRNDAGERLNTIDESLRKAESDLSQVLKADIGTVGFVKTREYAYQTNESITDKQVQQGIVEGSLKAIYDGFAWEDIATEIGMSVDALKKSVKVVVDEQEISLQMINEDVSVVNRLYEEFTAFFEEQVSLLDDVQVEYRNTQIASTELATPEQLIEKQNKLITDLKVSQANTQKEIDELEEPVNEAESQNPKKTLIKGILLGTGAGLVLIMGYLAASYAMSGRLHTEEELFTYEGLYHIGTVNKDVKNNKMVLLRLNESAAQKDVLYVSSLAEKDLAVIQKRLGIAEKIYPRVMTEERSFEMLKDYDHFILFEAGEISKVKMIQEEIRYFEKNDKCIIGYVFSE